MKQLILFLISTFAFGQWWYPTVEVVPENPNQDDNISIIVYGDTPNLIISTNSEVSIIGTEVVIDVQITQGLLTAIGTFYIEQSLGNLLEGEYHVTANVIYQEDDGSGDLFVFDEQSDETDFIVSSELNNCCDAEDAAIADCGGLGCYIPQCTDDCAWEPIQCWSSTGYCWCVDEEGNEIEGTSQPSWQGLPECSEECNDPNNIEIEGYCFNQDDIAALQDMINNSMNSGLEDSPNPYMANGSSITIDGEYIDYLSSNNNEIVEPLELGIQEWENGRLTSLMCGAYIYCDLSGEIPESISNLEDINVLRLELNYFSGFVPESICYFEHLDYDDNLAFDLSYNQLCPPYPECVAPGSVQYIDTSNCYQQGDVNHDSEINVIDIVLLVGFILMTDEPTDAEFDIGDVNNDNIINVLDVVLIVQMILNPMDEDCYVIPEIGPCDGICPTYYYNQDTNECEEFITGCCGVEAFNTMQDCLNACD
tara:strand:- start:425 stop:1864 length:1440 start_codon:yes stop_codon:yes gene_type:complete